MNADSHPPQGPPAERPRRNLCGRLKPDAFGNVCGACVAEILRGHFPRLRRALGECYGRRLDEWVAAGHFTVACWEVELEFEVREECLLPFLTSVVRDAFRARTVSLELLHAAPWLPADAREVAAALNERCAEGLCHLLAQHLAAAIRSVPTLGAERELIEVMSGCRSATQRGRQAALDAAAFTTANPLWGSAAVLLHLRYGAGRNVETYTEVSGGEIDPVWREIKELLPQEGGRPAARGRGRANVSR